MKKVVMFAGPQHEIPPTKGAAVQTWINEVSKRIIKYQIHIISISHEFYPLKEFKDGVYYHRIKFSKVYKRIFQKILGWDWYSYNKRVFNIIKQINPDIIHIHNYFNSFEIVNWVRKFNKKTKIILHMHNESDKFLKKEYPKVDFFFGCSKYIVSKYKNIIDANELKHIYNGIDLEKFNLKLNIKNENNIGYFGRISPEKGVEKFIELAKLMKNTNFNFLAFGEISQKGDRYQYYKKLKKEIDKNNLNVTFYDYIPPHKINRAYHYASYIIIPSKFEEPFGMVALEALASKKIVIASKKGGLTEFLDDNNSILINDYENFSKIAKNKILSLTLEDKKRLIENGIKTAKKFSWDNIAINVEEEYDRLIKK